MDINNAFDEILKIQDKLDKTNAVNPKITVNGKECILYHTGKKPSASDVNALALSGNGYANPVTGNIVLDNNIAIVGKLPSQENASSLIKFGSDDKAHFGGIYRPTIIESSENPTVNVEGTNYTMYHTGNKPSASDIGASSILFCATFPAMTNGWLGAVNNCSLNKNSCFSSLSTSYFTAPSNGLYRISGQVAVSGESAMYYYIDSSSSPNGTIFHTASITNSRVEPFISEVISLTSGQKVKFYSSLDTSFTLNSFVIEKFK